MLRSLTLCLIRRSSSDSSLVGRCTVTASSAGASVDCAAAAAILQLCLPPARTPHWSLLGQLPLLKLLLLLWLLLHAAEHVADRLSCGCSEAAPHGAAAASHCEQLLAMGRQRCSSHLGLILLQAMLCACGCCSAFMLRKDGGSLACDTSCWQLDAEGCAARLP